MASLSSIPIPSGLSASKLPSSSSSPAAMISVAKLVPSTTSPKFKIISRSATNSTNPSTSHFAAVALALTIAASPLAAPLDASAEISGLTPCKESKAFAKREKQALKKLESSLKLYEPESAPALAIKATMEKTKKRFDNYGSYGLLCGADGLPHLIVSGDQRHWGEFITPGILFLYIAGWIGWVGRSYLIAIRGEKKPTMKEIIIDVPLASRLLWRGFIWPVAALREYVNGDLVVADKDVSVAQDL